MTKTWIEDYALVGDCETAALVSRHGSVDWLCLPRFDSAACFAALLGTPEHGRWLIAPAVPVTSTRRWYRGPTAVLETEFTTRDGVVSVIDFMPMRSGRADLVRIVVGRRGTVPMRMELVIRFDYGSVVPWVRRIPQGISAVAGPDSLLLRTPVVVHGEQFQTVADFTVSEGQHVPFDLTWFPSHLEVTQELEPLVALRQTEEWWEEWSARCTIDGPWRDAIQRSLITLKALTYQPTGAIVAAPTTGLPEQFGGVRNWDYRYCWLRDATFTLLALMNAGYTREARAWREWLVRAAAGRPDQIHIMYGLAGERRLPEIELDWLPGFAQSRPVRIGNAAHAQFQLDVFGEILDATHQAWKLGVPLDDNAWRVDTALATYLESAWREPDEGIWEVRGPRRHFTHSKMMAWVAMDRAVKCIEQFKLAGPIDRWRAVRDAIHEDVCRHGFNADLGSFVQSYGSTLLDAGLLMMPLVGFLPASDERVRGTVDAIQRHLVRDGFVARYQATPDVDGLPPGEATFLLCSFWLVDNLELQGRHREARELFERLLSVRNDVGLLAEGYDTERGRLAGNFPQAFSHVGLINTAFNLSRRLAPAVERGVDSRGNSHVVDTASSDS
ncbi:MAG TPA: glycoside hydrolase family 15 protein [Steroidobacteraceae bacterium]|nr:glycoside hydrolase family 15 protein [Steroidobacteraceae bacterium]